MVYKKIQSGVALFMSVIMSIVFVSGAASFTISPTEQPDLSLKIKESKDFVYTVSNSGDVALNLTFENSGSSFVSLNDSSVTNLSPGKSVDVKVTVNPKLGTSLKSYTEKFIFKNTDDSSHKVEDEISVKVLAMEGGNLTITDFDDDLVKLEGDLDEKEDVSFRIKNTGNIDLTDLKFEFFDLDGRDEGDEIDKKELDIDDEGFDLDVGDSKRVKLEVDIPDDVEIDTYTGKAVISTDEGYEFEYRVELKVEGGDLEISISDSKLSLKSNVMNVIGEPGENVDDYEFEIQNDGNINAKDLVFELKNDLSEEFSDEEIDKDLITFSKNKFDLDADDELDIEMKFDIPEGTKAGTYTGEVRVKTDDGKVQDSFRLSLKVVGDVYTKEIEFPEKAKLGEKFEVKVPIKNQGSKVQRNVKITGTIVGIDYGDSDLIESTNNFILNAGEEEVHTLKFNIPEDAQDGEHKLEIKVSYEDGTLYELEEITVDRPAHNLKFQTFGIGKSVLKCDDVLYVFTKVENLGSEDEDVTFTTEIIGTDVKKVLKDVSIEVDETKQQNFNLDVSGLEPGSYEIVSKISYSGFFLKKSDTFVVRECNDASTGLDIKPIDEGKNSTGGDVGVEDDSDEKFELFGQKLEQKQVYMIVAIGVVFVLIIVSLFFI